MSIELITLDLDNTLWDVDRTIRRAERAMRAWMASHAPQSLAHYEQETVGKLRAQIARQHPQQVHDLSFMRIAVLTEVMQLAGYGVRSRTLAEQAFEVFFAGRNDVIFFPGARQALQSLAAEFRLIALTNGNADIQRIGIGKYFVDAISSADVGASKPDPRMFNAPLDSLDLQPHQAIHVGDSLIDDISGAHQVGMLTVWVNLKQEALTDSQVAPHATATHLSQLPDTIRELVRS